MTKTNEMFDTLPPSPVEIPSPIVPDTSVATVAYVEPVGPAVEDIIIYADSISPPSFDPASGLCLFDVMLTVSIACPPEADADPFKLGGVSKTYKITKRIAFDKKKLASEAMISVPVTVIEDTSKSDKEKLETIKRYKTLAGLA